MIKICVKSMWSVNPKLSSQKWFPTDMIKFNFMHPLDIARLHFTPMNILAYESDFVVYILCSLPILILNTANEGGEQAYDDGHLAVEIDEFKVVSYARGSLSAAASFLSLVERIYFGSTYIFVK